MKYFLSLLLIAALSLHAGAQSTSKMVNPKAKKLEDSAIKLFPKCGESASCYTKVNKLLDQALKIEPKWYEGWNNLISFLGRTDQYDKCLAATQKLVQLYPTLPDALFECGIMQLKTKHYADADVTLGKLLKIYEDLLRKSPKVSNHDDLLIQKGITLVLLGHDYDGKAILRQIYNNETEPYKKSFIAFYINKTREEIVDDKIPGK